MNWKNKRIIITGGSSGIGKQIVHDLHAKGAIIVFCGTNKQRIESVAKPINIKGIQVDLRQEDQLNSFFNTAIKHLGGVDILINNAGYVITNELENLNRADFQHMFAINTIAPFQLAKLTFPYFQKQGIGDIVNIGATGGNYAFNNGSAYSCSKSALSMLSQSMNKEWRKNNIRTFHIDPSWCTGTNNNNKGTSIPFDENKMIPEDISSIIIQMLEMNRRVFVPQMSIWESNPFS